jgi:hypothetical protein
MSVANRAEAVGRLLATSGLMKGDRELMRRQSDLPAQETAESAPQPSSPPLAHDSKAVAAVLLNLLNERLQASDIEAMNRQDAQDGKAASDDATSPPKHIAARYAEDGLTSNGDPARPEMTNPLGQGPLRDAAPRTAPELQSFIQRLMVLATDRSDSRAATGADGRRDRANSSTSDSLAIVRIVIAALAVLGLAALISGWLPG